MKSLPRTYLFRNKQLNKTSDDHTVYQLYTAFQRKLANETWRMAIVCTNSGKGRTTILRNASITSRPTTVQIEKLLKTHAKECGMIAKKLMELEGNNELVATFAEIVGEFMNDTHEKISPRADLDIHYEAVEDLREAAEVSRGMKHGKATPP